MKIRTHAATGLVFAAFVATISASPVSAHRATYPTSIQLTGITSPPLTFRGLISSTKDACFANRKIVLRLGEDVVGESKTEPTGHYSVVSNTNDRGEYVIAVRKKVLRRGAGHKHVCGAASTSFTY